MKKYILSVAFLLASLSPALVQAQVAGGGSGANSCLSSIQVSAILSLLQAFGADQSVINNVQVALSCGASSTTFSASPTYGTAPLSVGFTSNVSGGVIDFGDGGKGGMECAIGATVGAQVVCGSSHTYTAPGSYTATLQTLPSCAKTTIGTILPSCSPVTIDKVAITVTASVPPTPTSNYNPTGVIDNASSGTSCGLVNGWAYDPDKSSQSIDVHMYVDGPAGSGTGHVTGATTVARPDVNTVYGITGVHGFSYQLPTLSAGTHTVYAYGIGVNSAGASDDNNFPALSNSPKTFTCSTSTQAPTVTSSFNPAFISSTGSTVYSYSSTNTTHCVASHPDGTGGWDNIITNASFPPTTYTAAQYPNGLTTTITCYNSAGQSAVSTATLTVQTSPTVAPTITSFTASSPSIISGQSTTLSWTSTGAETTYNSCLLDANGTVGLGSKAANSSFAVSPTVTTTYNLLCSKYNPATNRSLNSQVAHATVTVTAASTPTPTVTSSFSPSTITSNGSTVYSYSSTNTTHCVATHPDGTMTWDNVTPNASFSDTYTASQFPNGLTTTQTCYNAAGQSAVSTQTLTVIPAPTVTSSFSPSTISPTGSTVYSYSSTNTTHCVTTHPNGTGTWDNLTPNASFSSTYNASQFPNGLTTTQTCYNVAGQSTVSTATLTVTNQGASAYDAFNNATNSGPSESSGTGNTSVFHYVWNNNLQIGSSYTEDVKALQTALTREGVYTGEISGGFYNQTFSAVKAFQQKYGIDTGTSGAGFVGSKTRAKLNTLY